MPKVKVNLDFLKEFGEIKADKTAIHVSSNNKRAHVMITGTNVTLEDFKPDYGNGFKVFDEATIKRAHLGKAKCVKKCKTEQEIREILKKYFA